MELKFDALKLIGISFMLFFWLISDCVHAQTAYDAQLKNTIIGAEKIGAAFAKPASTAVATALASGWSSSGKTLAPWKIDIRVGGSLVWIPENDRTLDLNTLQLPSNFSFDNTAAVYPSILGGANNNPNRIALLDSDGERLTSFTMPAGINRTNVPVPEFQIGTGLPFQSAIYIRFVPSLNVSDYGKAGAFGFALQKQILHTQFKRQRELNVSLLGGFNQIHYNYSLLEKHRIVEDPNANKANYSDQRVKSHFNVWNVDAIASYKIPFQSHVINSCFKFTNRAYKPLDTYFEPFMDVGFQTAQNVFNAYGKYNLKASYDTDGNTIYTDLDGQDYVKNIETPVLNQFQGTVGVNLNIAFVNLYASYSVGQYSWINAGLSFKFFAYKAKHDKLTGF